MFQLLLCQKKNDIKLLEKLKSGFKRTIKWNKYLSQMSVQNNNNKLNYLIDPTFTNVKELKKTMLRKIIEIFFHIIMYQMLK